LHKLPNRLSESGPVVEYLNDIGQHSPELAHRAKQAVQAVRRCLNTEDGAILLDLLEKSTTLFFLHPRSNERACDNLNAQRFIALDLRRIASNEVELEQNDHKGARGRGRG